MLCMVVVSAFADEPQPPVPSESDVIIGGHEYVDPGLPCRYFYSLNLQC